MAIQGNLLARKAVTSLRPSDVGETQVETTSAVRMDAKFLRGFMWTSATLKSNQDLDSGGVESKDTIKEDVPVALRTRSRDQTQHPTEAMKSEDFSERLRIEVELKELLKQLIIQNKNQQDLQHEILQMKSTLKDVLEMQITSIQDIQRNIVALKNDYQEKFSDISIPSSISDPKTMVNRFTPVTTEIDVIHDTSRCINFELQTTSRSDVTDDVNIANNASSRHCAYMARSEKRLIDIAIDAMDAIKDENISDKDSEVNIGVYIKANGKDTGRGIHKMLPTGPLNDSAVSYAKAFMATPKKKNPKDTSNSYENSEIYGSPSASDDGQEIESSDESLTGSEEISGLSSAEDTEEDLSSSQSIDPMKKMHPNAKEFQRRSQQKGRYTVPTKSEKVRHKAQERIEAALNQVPDAVHFNPEGQRTTKTLYVGNLDYNSDSTPLHKALRQYFRKRIKVDEVIVPENNGKSRGYAFVTLSWAKTANVNPSDICKAYSGMIYVNSRYTYLHKLRNDNLQTGYLGRSGTASIAKM
jgi:hypothetical protein